MFRKTRSLSPKNSLKRTLSRRAHSLDRINVLNKGSHRNKRVNFLTVLEAARRMNKKTSKLGKLLKMVGHPRRSDLARHIASFTTPMRKIDNYITKESVSKLLEYYGENAEYRRFLQQRGINPIVFCKIVFFMKKNNSAKIMMGLNKVLDLDERNERVLYDGFDAVSNYSPNDAEDQLHYELEDQLTATKVVSLYQRYKRSIDNLELSREEQRKVEDTLRMIQLTESQDYVNRNFSTSGFIRTPEGSP